MTRLTQNLNRRGRYLDLLPVCTSSVTKLPAQYADSSVATELQIPVKRTYHTVCENRQQVLVAGEKPADATKPRNPRSRFQARAEKGAVTNAAKVAWLYEEYLSRPDVVGYRDVAEHFGVTKPMVSYYRALLHRLPTDFVAWLEGCEDRHVLAFFTEKRLRPITRLESVEQRTRLLTEAQRLATELNPHLPDELSELLGLISDTSLPTPAGRLHRAVQLD